MLSFLSTAAAVTLPTAAPPFRLPMLPFDYADAMLPGETLQVALDEPAHHALLLEALHRRHGPLDKGCFGQLLKRDHDRASSIAPLLQITQTLPARSHASTWIEVKCVGRARVDRFDQSPDACFDAAYVRELVDRPTAAAADGGDGDAAAAGGDGDAAASLAAAKIEEVAWAHDECAELKWSLHMQRGGGAPSRLRWARDSATCSEEPRVGTALASLVESRISVLRERGMDAAPAPALCGHPALRWGAESEESAERQVESFAAFHFLGAQERYAALACDDTLRRYGIALRALGRRVLELRAEAALYSAFAV